MIRRLGTSRRRGMILGLGPLDAVLRALAVAIYFVGGGRSDGAGGVERAADNVVANTGKIFDTASANQDDRVLLEIVPFAGDVRRHLHSVRQANAANLSKR